MKKFLFGLMASVALLAVSCDNSTSEDNNLYEEGVKKENVRKR